MTQYLYTLPNMFFYGGLEKNEYSKLRSAIHEANRMLLKVFSPIAGFMFFLLFTVSVATGGFAAVNSPTYLVCGLVMLSIGVCVHYFVPQYPMLVTVLVHLFEIVLYAFSIRISMLHADNPAVSAVAFLLVSPLLFYDRPVRLSALLAADVVAFCVMVHFTKLPEVAQTDTWNMVTFGFVAVVTTLFIMTIKMRALAQAKKIEYMGQTDLLTGLKNRNHYEKQLSEYPIKCSSNLICVYGDVNGLHELNNTQGHQAGDTMLREVASSIMKCFDPEHTYRLGGDEFAAFKIDTQPETVYADVERISEDLAAKGYHISFGIAVREKKDGINMQELVKEAETLMYTAKSEFYRKPEFNRRSR